MFFVRFLVGRQVMFNMGDDPFYFFE